MEETVAVEETVPAEDAVQEQPAASKTGSKRITASIVAIVLVAGILIGLIAGTMGSKPVQPALDPTVAATEEAKPVVIPSNGDPKSPLCKASYTVSDEQAMASADVVVATMGDKTLTNGELQAWTSS